MLSEIGEKDERLIRRLHTWCSTWRNAGPQHMMETVMIVFAIGVFLVFAVAMVLAAIVYFWVDHD
jgi:hypothetical protein